MKTPLASAIVGALCLSASPLNAQQFQYQAGALPGTPRWAEGVELADVDGDGDLDIFFAEGDGYSSAGAKRQNILIINKLVEIGPGIFADESVARLGVHLSNAKGIATGDVNGDGYIDVLFANGYNTDVPFLYINRGAAQPGYFDLESSTRGFTEALSSAGAQFGDVDDDGDLDIIINDSGSSFLFGAGARPRLYMNDGTGHFTENAAGMNAPIKKAQMDVQLVDIDNDWDLDFYCPNRATNPGGNHFLMLNDGAGNFTDASFLFPSQGDMTYEAEVGDLDGDGDLDMFELGLSGYREAVVLNNLLPTGVLSFTPLPLLPGSVDDNEVGLLDFDNDGDLDVFIGSLGSTERIYVNDGSAGLVLNSSLISHIGDSTLDLALGDIDGDGDYDIITSQGESGSSQWANKLYLNTGAPDTLPPVIVATDVPANFTSLPVVAHGKCTDQMIDDGVTYVTARAAFAAVSDSSAGMAHSGGAFVPAVLNIEVGTPVEFTNLDGTAQSVTSITMPYTFDLALAPSGGTAEFIFVSPGSYNIFSSTSGAFATINVTGSATEVAGTLSGGGIYRFEIGDMGQGPQVFASEIFFEDSPGNVSVSTGHVSVPATVGSNYCVGGLNSLGLEAHIYAMGSAVAADDNLALHAVNMPTGQFGLFFYGLNQLQVPFGSGFLCLSGSIARLGPPLAVDGNGRVSRVVSLTTQPALGDITSMVPIQMNFQFWYRDGGTFNLTEGLSINFQ